jgi:uncharacterized membrane protein
MPKLTYAENPIHPVVNDYPAALVPASLVFDMLHLVTRRGSFKVAAFWSLLLALVTGGVAAATGLQDYRDIPEGTEEKRLANAHAMLNAGMLGALAVQVLMRITGRVGIVARLLNVATVAGLVAADRYGTSLVYRHGVGVHGADPLAATPAAPAPLLDRDTPFADRLQAAMARGPEGDRSRYVSNDLDIAEPVSEL